MAHNDDDTDLNHILVKSTHGDEFIKCNLCVTVINIAHGGKHDCKRYIKHSEKENLASTMNSVKSLEFTSGHSTLTAAAPWRKYLLLVSYLVDRYCIL